MTGAPKADDGKSRMDLLHPDFLGAVADVLRFGAKKYAPWSWLRGKAWSRDYAALQRHLAAWHGGEDRDPETGLSHLAHAACDLMFLLVSQARGLGEDDRPRVAMDVDAEKRMSSRPPPTSLPSNGRPRKDDGRSHAATDVDKNFTDYMARAFDDSCACDLCLRRDK